MSRLALTYQQECQPEAGCDEAGRGCLSGPVFAAAVILPPDYQHKTLNDSKQLKESVRMQLREEIMREAVAWSVASVSEQEIDRINILQASILAMHRALQSLSVQPGYIAVDGNRFRSYRDVPYQTLVKGDARFLHIAAASVLAKTSRDMYMMQLHHEFPLYGWDKNKGYATADHREAIMKYGRCAHHRMSFVLKESQLQLFS